MKKSACLLSILLLGVILLFTGCASLGPVYQKVEKSDAEIRNEIKEACKKAKETDKLFLLDSYNLNLREYLSDFKFQIFLDRLLW
jgi:hypothetical protein